MARKTDRQDIEEKITDLVVDYFYDIFDKIFTERFQLEKTHRIKRDKVIRSIQDSALASSQSLIRFFINSQLSEKQASGILNGLKNLPACISLDDISNPNVTPESIVGDLLDKMPCSRGAKKQKLDALHRTTLHSIVQVLMFVGPILVQWQRLHFSSSFELPRRLDNRLNQISKQMNALGLSGEEVDYRYEIDLPGLSCSAVLPG